MAGSTISRTSSTLSSTYFSKGQAVVCVVTPSDGTDSGTAVNSNTVTIQNSAPEVSAVTVTRASPSSIRRSMVTESSGEVSGAHGDASAGGYQVAAPRETPA